MYYKSYCWRETPGSRLNTKIVFSVIEINMLKIRRSQDRLIFNMALLKLVQLYIEMAPGRIFMRLSVFLLLMFWCLTSDNNTHTKQLTQSTFIVLLQSFVQAIVLRIHKTKMSQWHSTFSSSHRTCIIYKKNHSIQTENDISQLQWRHNGLDSASNHQPRQCLLNRLLGVD